MTENDRLRRFAGSMAAIVVLALGMTAALSAVAKAQTSRQGPITSEMTAPPDFHAPQLDGIALTMAYDRLNGTVPDFRPYAEQSGSYLNATVFDRPVVLNREIARLKGVFATFDLNRIYSMRISVTVEQYEAQRQGYPLDFGPSSEIPVSDPVTYHQYSLAFRNADAADFLVAGDADAARMFAERNVFEMQGSVAAQGVLQLTFRLVDVPPTIDASHDTVRADIVAARLLSQNGTLIHDFGNLASPGDAPVRGFAVLKRSDVQGFHIGMSAAEAMSLGSRGWMTTLGSDGLNVIAFFNGLQPAKPTWARCGSLDYGTPSPMAMFTGATSPPFKDCIGVRLVGPTTSGATRKVDTIVSQQNLGETDPASVVKALNAKYGDPMYVRDGGMDLVWLGRDPARPDASPVQIIADVHSGITTSDAHETALDVSEKAYADPRPKPIVQATGTAAKL